MLSLSPRYDLFRFHLPKTFLPPEIEQKYTEILNKDAYTMTSAIDYLNESSKNSRIIKIEMGTVEYVLEKPKCIK